MTIETYPEMNAKIVDILRLHGRHETLYAAQRIEELETATAHLERLDAASQRALARAMRENRVRDECLALAVETLALYTEGSTDGVPAQGTLVEIETRLTELEPEKEISNDDDTTP